MVDIPPANLGGYPGAPPNPGGGARGGMGGGVGGVPPAAGGPGAGPPLPPNLNHPPLCMRSGTNQGIYLSPLSVPKYEGSLGKYLWVVSKKSKETDIVSDLDTFQTEWASAVEPENATSLNEAYFEQILPDTMPLVFLKMMPGT